MLIVSQKESCLYLQVNTKKNIKKGQCWFLYSPIRKNTLGKVVGKVTSAAKLDGYFTNHSLRSTCTTVLYNDDSNLPEQVIAERTGHRSLAIRSYKRTKDALKRKVSNILTDMSAGVDSNDHDRIDCKQVKLEPMKHSVLKEMRDGNVKNVKLDICVSLKE